MNDHESTNKHGVGCVCVRDTFMMARNAAFA